VLAAIFSRGFQPFEETYEIFRISHARRDRDAVFERCSGYDPAYRCISSTGFDTCPGRHGGPVHVVGTISSGSAKVGDVFQIQAADDVVINDMIVVRKGAGGQGHIANSDSAGGNGHSGATSLAFDFVYAADGGRVGLATSPQKQAEEDRKGASSTATIIGFAAFGLGGLFAHNLAHGRQKTIDETTTMSAFVDANVHVDSDEHAVPVHYDH
jgi:hypothetical protein